MKRLEPNKKDEREIPYHLILTIGIMAMFIIIIAIWKAQEVVPYHWS